MKEKRTEAEAERFFAEAGRKLGAAGYNVQAVEEKQMPVEWKGRSLCRITGEGGICFLQRDLEQEEYRSAYDKLRNIVNEVSRYMYLIEAAPPLKASGLGESYKLLADFNGAVLAGHPTKMGIQFVTWEWDYDHTGMWQGHYYNGDYARAKADFAVRAGLIERDRLFSPEQQTEVYRSIHETLDGAYSMTDERRNLLESAAAQIERTIPDLQERVYASNLQEVSALEESRGLEML